MPGSCRCPEDPCPRHCEDCGIAWQPGFVRVTVELGKAGTDLWGLFCPTCWERVYVT